MHALILLYLQHFSIIVLLLEQYFIEQYYIIQFVRVWQIPNGLGVMFAVAQLVLYAMYYKSTQQQIEARRRKGEVGMEEVVVIGDGHRVGSSQSDGQKAQT